MTEPETPTTPDTTPVVSIQSGSRRRYADPLNYQEQRQRAKALENLGLPADHPPYTESEVVVLDGPDGPVRVWADKVEDYHRIWAEMATGKAVDEAMTIGADDVAVITADQILKEG